MSSGGRPIGRGRGLKTKQQEPLQKPNMINSKSPAPGKTTLPSESDATVSTTSPRTAQSDSTVHHHAKADKLLNAAASEFVPRAAKSQPIVTISHHPAEPVHVQQYAQLVDYIERVLNALYTNPSHFDIVVPDLNGYLQKELVDNETMETAADVLFEWAVAYDNFSYICARICQHLHTHLKNDHTGTFSVHVIKRCHTEHESRDTCEPQRLRNFAILLAELYTRLVGNDGHRLKSLMIGVCELVETMMAKLDNEFAKTVGQTLKMCGACLEDDLLRHNKLGIMENIVAQLQKPRPSCNINQNMTGLLQSVITIRAANWGRTSSEPSTPQQSPAPDFSQEPVFFSPSGQQISRVEAGYDNDESAFPPEYSTPWFGADSADLSAGDFHDFPDSDDDGDDDDGMDDEMYAMYEQFEKDFIVNNDSNNQ